MKLKELIEYLTDEMECNKWQNKTVKFGTIDRGELDFLSIYESDHKGRVDIDVGTDEDSDKRNSQM